MSPAVTCTGTTHGVCVEGPRWVFGQGTWVSRDGHVSVCCVCVSGLCVSMCLYVCRGFVRKFLDGCVSTHMGRSICFTVFVK